MEKISSLVSVKIHAFDIIPNQTTLMCGIQGFGYKTIIKNHAVIVDVECALFTIL